MTDEKIHVPPSHSREPLRRYLLLERLACVMEKMIDAKLTDPDTETYEIIGQVASKSKGEETDSRLDPKNLQPVMDAMRRHNDRRR